MKPLSWNTTVLAVACIASMLSAHAVPRTLDNIPQPLMDHWNDLQAGDHRTLYHHHRRPPRKHLSHTQHHPSQKRSPCHRKGIQLNLVCHGHAIDHFTCPYRKGFILLKSETTVLDHRAFLTAFNHDNRHDRNDRKFHQMDIVMDGPCSNDPPKHRTKLRTRKAQRMASLEELVCVAKGDYCGSDLYGCNFDPTSLCRCDALDVKPILINKGFERCGHRETARKTFTSPLPIQVTLSGTLTPRTPKVTGSPNPDILTASTSRRWLTTGHNPWSFPPAPKLSSSSPSISTTCSSIGIHEGEGSMVSTMNTGRLDATSTYPSTLEVRMSITLSTALSTSVAGILASSTRSRSILLSSASTHADENSNLHRGCSLETQHFWNHIRDHGIIRREYMHSYFINADDLGTTSGISPGSFMETTTATATFLSTSHMASIGGPLSSDSTFTGDLTRTESFVETLHTTVVTSTVGMATFTTISNYRVVHGRRYYHGG
ncbi:MAG: hypothetical protein J3Q66DRAFT_397094 [Benniella sp.]|nr:MAG: hypothetical protein J3Q66DRAFT_397094 [Benniella sp.]